MARGRINDAAASGSRPKGLRTFEYILPYLLCRSCAGETATNSAMQNAIQNRYRAASQADYKDALNMLKLSNLFAESCGGIVAGLVFSWFFDLVVSWSTVLLFSIMFMVMTPMYYTWRGFLYERMSRLSSQSGVIPESITVTAPTPAVIATSSAFDAAA